MQAGISICKGICVQIDFAQLSLVWHNRSGDVGASVALNSSEFHQSRRDSKGVFSFSSFSWLLLQGTVIPRFFTGYVAFSLFTIPLHQYTSSPCSAPSLSLTATS